MGKPILPPARRFAADDRDLERRVRVLESRLYAAASSSGDADWTYPTVPAYVNTYTGNAVRYRKLSSGLVVLAGFGMILSTQTISESTPLFTLPVGYRPLPVLAPISGAYNTHHFYLSPLASRSAVIDRDGDVFFDSSSFVGGNLFNLNGITFYPQQ